MSQCLEQFLSDSLGTWQEDWSWSVDDPFTFLGQMSGSQQHFYAQTVFAQYLEKFMSDSHCTWQEDWSWSVDEHMNAEV